MCKSYFAILSTSFKTEICIQQICAKSSVSIEEAEMLLPKLQKNYKKFFLTTLLLELDQETLNEFEEEIYHDNISNVYEKILEGMILRFEKYLLYRPALKILSDSLDLRFNNFLELLENNHYFMLNLLDLVEQNKNQFVQTLKSIALNVIFVKATDVFLKEENSSLDSTIRCIDKYLREIEDLGYMTGIIKK